MNYNATTEQTPQRYGVLERTDPNFGNETNVREWQFQGLQSPSRRMNRATSSLILLLLLFHYKGQDVVSTFSAPCHEDVWGSGGTAPHFIDIGTTWVW
jgi:hypothetical protein